MQVWFDRSNVAAGSGSAVVLVCPSCNNAYLHQLDVTVYQRVKEDGPARKTVAPTGGGPASEYFVQSGAPGRRDTIEIAMDCEGCRAQLTLEIQQHKGQTLVRWVEA